MAVEHQSSRSTYVIIAAFVAIAVAGFWWTWGRGDTQAAQQKKKGPVVISVLAGKAQKKDVPYRVESLGTVQPLVTVSIRSRVDSQVLKVHFEDGAKVNEGDPLFTLDSRAIDAQILQAEATLNRDKAQLEKAVRDVERISGLAAKGTLSQVQEADAKTSVEVLNATAAQNEAILQNLRVLRTYYDVKAPVSGRIGVANVRQGAIVRSADSGTPLATINQIAPIYVAFGVPERFIPELRAAGEKAAVELSFQNELSLSGGKVAFIENTVDPQPAPFWSAVFREQRRKALAGHACLRARDTSHRPQSRYGAGRSRAKRAEGYVRFRDREQHRESPARACPAQHGRGGDPR
jgi:multidrug efflux system membrane fusion protein